MLVDQIGIRPESGEKFSDGGDSGSCNVTADDTKPVQKVLGILVGGDMNTQPDGLKYSYASHIGPVLSYFKISICPSPNAELVQSNK